MAKYSHEQVVLEKRCGIKYFDKAVEKVGRQNLIKQAIEISKNHPDVWGKGWSNFSWALANAVIEIVNHKSDISQSYNIDEVLTTVEIQNIITELNIVDPFVKTWDRKKVKVK